MKIIKTRKTVKLSSTSQLDVIQVKEFGFWDHSCDPNQAEVGDVVVIAPNSQQTKIYGDDTIAVTGVLKFLENNIESDVAWASNNAGSDKQYVTRMHIDDIKLVKLSDISNWVMNKRMGPKGVQYI